MTLLSHLPGFVLAIACTTGVIHLSSERQLRMHIAAAALPPPTEAQLDLLRRVPAEVLQHGDMPAPVPGPSLVPAWYRDPRHAEYVKALKYGAAFVGIMLLWLVVSAYGAQGMVDVFFLCFIFLMSGCVFFLAEALLNRTADEAMVYKAATATTPVDVTVHHRPSGGRSLWSLGAGFAFAGAVVAGNWFAYYDVNALLLGALLLTRLATFERNKVKRSTTLLGSAVLILTGFVALIALTVKPDDGKDKPADDAGGGKPSWLLLPSVWLLHIFQMLQQVALFAWTGSLIALAMRFDVSLRPMHAAYPAIEPPKTGAVALPRFNLPAHLPPVRYTHYYVALASQVAAMVLGIVAVRLAPVEKGEAEAVSGVILFGGLFSLATVPLGALVAATCTGDLKAWWEFADPESAFGSKLNEVQAQVDESLAGADRLDEQSKV